MYFLFLRQPMTKWHQGTQCHQYLIPTFTSRCAIFASKLIGRSGKLVELIKSVRLVRSFRLANLIVRLVSIEIFWWVCKCRVYIQLSLKCFEFLTDFEFVIVELEIATPHRMVSPSGSIGHRIYRANILLIL